MTAVGSPQQHAEKIAADLATLADKLDTLRDRPDWHHDDVIAPAPRALVLSSRSTPAQRARARAVRDEERANDPARGHAARSPHHGQRRAHRRPGECGPSGQVEES